MLRRLLFFLSIGFPFCLYGHGDLHERIQSITSQIQLAPKDLELYQQRGELYLQHAQYRKATRDFSRCERKGVVSDRLDYCLAKAAFHQKNLRRSLTYIEKVLDVNPHDIKSLRLKSKLLDQLGNQEEAALCLEEILQSAIKTIPENYLEAAQAWSRADQLRRSIAILESGIQTLGHVPNLQKPLIEFYRQNGQWIQILALQTRMVNDSRRKEFSLYDRALTHQKMGDAEACRSDLIAARQAIQILPAGKKESAATKTLKNNIEQLFLELF